MKELEKSYNPKGIEGKWYTLWSERGYFSPEASGGKPYSIVIPPPNVTGSLHMGHALNAALQDILIRWKRMLGYRCLWVPGTDHAGIATQNVVERELAKEGLDRNTLGREAFIERIWKWKAEYGGRIIHQLKRIGASCDWSRERFTLDEGLSRAVREVFVRLYEEGLIYRDNRLINWCPRCHTALSDLEVEHEELDGLLTYLRYPLSDGGGYVIVATTRPETMLGDTAVAVNPGDERYRDIIGKTLQLPLTGRAIPVISDSAVDPSFGTGAVKVTPAHDFNDEAMAKRQSPPLDFVTVIDDRGRMTEDAGRVYAGMDRYECRRRVVKDLKEAGLLEKEEKYRYSVGHCYRCKTIIEPLSTLQWYVSVKPLAGEAMTAVKDGRIRIVPGTWENTYFSWMENIKDWCISRQIWWGHRIPVWYCQEMENEDCRRRKGVVVLRETPRECPYCGSLKLVQDEDVLDTWFSSSLWPFSTLGWPDETADLRTFYPTSVLVTGFDILFFWVARMSMMGIKFMEAVPFRDVYIHALVRDSKGQKMSKSKGNVVDPLIMIEKYGADAFRFSLAAFAAQGRDIRFSEERVEGYRYFVNKLWNAARFVMMNAEAAGVAADVRQSGLRAVKDLAGRWVLSRLAATTEEVNKALGDYRFNDAASSIYQFIWHEFCDWYIEMSKDALYSDAGDKAETISCLLSVLDSSLRLLHPFMPFVTEEVWQSIGKAGEKSGESIVISPYPTDLPRDHDAEEEMFYLMEAVVGIRNVRGEMNISPGLEVRAFVRTFTDRASEVLMENSSFIKRLARVTEMTIGRGIERPKGAATAVKDSFEIYVPLEGLLNITAEIDRLMKEKKKVEESLGLLERKMMNDDFLKRAPRDIVEKEKAKHQELMQRDERLELGIQRLKEVEVKNG
ncbi:MAG TPA: valine--tRNA ligase [Thermodesulfovibrionales bacterium]|nr:valine--tRNA ligase [Thermodesulfovibrionales bacterium]